MKIKRSHIPLIILALCVGIYLIPDSPQPREPEQEPKQQQAYAYAAPEPVTPVPAAAYRLTARVVKVAPYRSKGSECDVEITNTSDQHIKFIMLQMTYTGLAGEYLGTCDVAVHNLPAGASGIGIGHIRPQTPEQLGNYTMRVDSVVGSDGLLMTDRFTLAE